MVTRDTQINFPRSNNERSETKKNKTFYKSFVPEDEQLFKSRKRPSILMDKKKKKPKKSKQIKSSNLKKIPTSLTKTVIENMSLSRLIDNMVIYGCLEGITNFKLDFSLTNGIMVTVPITNISTPLTRLIEQFTNDNDLDVELPKLSSMFSIGDYFPVKIISKKTCDKFGRTEIIASINPKDIYHSLSVKTIEKLPSGFNMIAAVVSKEDYGYLMDIGVDDVKAFLPTEDLKKNGKKTELTIGELIQCSVNQTTERSLTLSVNEKLSNNFVLDEDHKPSILFYCPGVKTTAMINGIYNSGLELNLPGGYKGFVPRYHISDDLSITPKEFKLNDEIQGYVMYVHPHTKQVCISLKSKLKRKKIKNLIESIKIGMIVENAKVVGRSQFNSLIFKLPSNNYAISLKKNLFEPKEEFDEESLNRLYSIGSSHIARVKKFNLFDNLIEISLRKSFIERKETSLDDIRIGSIVEGSVWKYKPDGIYVKLGFGINGFIPHIHLSDTPLLNWEKNRNKLFPLKHKMKCRVLKLDYSFRIPKISLTAKNTLIKMDDEKIFKDLDRITPGMSSTGVVCLITDKGILLEFFNRLCGFIPLKYLATYKIDHPDRVFQLGQLVNCSVVSVDTNEQRMVCSLIDINEMKKLKQNLQIKNKNDSMNCKLQVGQILKKMKIISKIPMKGFDLTNPQEKIQVFLPLAHLSDDPFISRMLFTAYKVGDTFDQVMVFSKDSTNVVCVTKKNVFLKQTNQLVMKEEDIAINVPFPAVVRRVTSTGVFFETPNSQYGVIRKKFLQDGFYEEPQKLKLFIGQTIFVTAFDIGSFGQQSDCDDNYLKKFKFSMKLSSVWNKDENIRLDILKTFLEDYDLFCSKLREHPDKIVQRLSTYSIGQVVTYVVTDITEEHIKLNVSLTGNKNESSVPGIAIKYTNLDDITISQMGNGIVCDIDFEKKNLIVFLQPTPAKIIRQVKNFQKSNLNKLKLNQTVKGTVMHVREKFVLVVFGGHVPGLIAFVPTIKHYNDLKHIEKLYSIGQTYQFSIKHFEMNENENFKIIATLVDSSQKTSETTKITAISNLQNEPIPESKEQNKYSAPEENLPTEKILSPNISTIDKFDWDVVDLSKLNNKRKLDELKKSDDDLMDILDSDSDDDDDDDETQRKKTKKRDERNEQARQREALLREKENQLMDTDRTPQDEQDFEMAIIASPNSSLVWIKYMAFFLERKDFNKARVIGERALRKISFREEKERLNIWISLLNLENNFGDEVSMKQLLEKAIKFNDAKTIYSRLAVIYDESNKKDKAEQMYNSMIKKFYSDDSVWIDFLLFYMKNGRIESGRKLFQKALLSLDKRVHVDLISKFAQLEFRYGDCEKGKTIFESLLATYWKRLDKWSIYIDMLVKYTVDNDDDDSNNRVDAIEFIRNVFERLLTFKLPPHKMKFIFKKYYDFETKYSGEDVEILEKLKQKAAEYVENGIF